MNSIPAIGTRVINHCDSPRAMYVVGFDKDDTEVALLDYSPTGCGEFYYHKFWFDLAVEVKEE